MIIIVISGLCILKLLYPSISIESYAESITAITALCAFAITCKEYFSIKDSKKAQVFSEYNKRYSEDSNIVKVVQYLNAIDKDGCINNPSRSKPSNYEVEMFMRFFEELDLQIRYKRLEEKDVFDLFCYYADKLNQDSILSSLGVTDINENWDDFCNLIKRYNDYRKRT